MSKLPNQIIMPGAGAAAFQPAYPQPAPAPYLKGDPPEGPKTFLASVTIPAGQTTGTLDLDVSQFGMTMVQSIMVDNEANAVAVSVTSAGGLKFGIQPFGTQVFPIFLAGTRLTVSVMLASPVLSNSSTIFFQIFNAFVPPASWVSNLAVAGNVNVANVSGNVNVLVNNAALLGVSIQAATFGGARSFLVTALTATVITVKGTGAGTFKGVVGQAAATGWLQFFDAANPGLVTLGTTPPSWSIPVFPASTPIDPVLPPEGLTFGSALQVAFTTLINNAVAPGSNFQGALFYI